MANIRLIKGRIRSAKNIAQITKAMELVAASKMRKAQAAALSGKLYATKIYQMVMDLAARIDLVHHPLLTKPASPSGKGVVIVFATNKGLCGGLNATLFRFLSQTYGEKLRSQGFIVLGRKATDFLTRVGAGVSADFSQTIPFAGSVPALTELVTREFLSGTYDGVDLVYNEFLSVLKQEPRRKSILPLTFVPADQENLPPPFVIEPTISEVFDLLIPHYLENQIRDAVLQAEASEHSARMIAMRSATDNARSLETELTLLYNRARQEKITYEISDIVTARLAVN